MTDLPSLPADLWALIVSHLPIHTIMPVVVGNRFFQNEVLRLLPVLCIDRTSDLDIPTARKCLDLNSVTEVYIRSLLVLQEHRDRAKQEYNVKATVEASKRLIPFLSQFPSIKKVYIEGKQIPSSCLEFI